MKSKIDILTELLNKKGQIATIKIRRPLKTRKEFSKIKIIKESVMQIRCGINYDNINKVKEARYIGDLPAQNEGLSSNLIWSIYPYLLKNTKTNKSYFRFYTVNNNFVPSIKYILDKEEVTKDDIKQFVLASEISDHKGDKTCFNIEVNKIVEVR